MPVGITALRMKVLIQIGKLVEDQKLHGSFPVSVEAYEVAAQLGLMSKKNGYSIVMKTIEALREGRLVTIFGLDGDASRAYEDEPRVALTKKGAEIYTQMRRAFRGEDVDQSKMRSSMARILGNDTV